MDSGSILQPIWHHFFVFDIHDHPWQAKLEWAAMVPWAKGPKGPKGPQRDPWSLAFNLGGLAQTRFYSTVRQTPYY